MSARRQQNTTTYHCALVITTIAAFKCVRDVMRHGALIDVQIAQVGIDSHDTPRREKGTDSVRVPWAIGVNALLEFEIDSERIETEERNGIGDNPLTR
jgi:hypothetical protein